VQHEWERGVDQLPYEIAHIQFVPHQDVVLSERIVPLPGGVEAFVDVQVEREPHVVEAAGTLARGGDVGGPFDFEAVSEASHRKRDLGRNRKSVGPKVGDGDGLVNVELPTRTEDHAYVDFLLSGHVGSPAPEQPSNNRDPPSPCQTAPALRRLNGDLFGGDYLAVNGRGRDITRRDILAVARRQSVAIGRANSIVDEVLAAVESLPSIAREFGVTRATRAEIAAATGKKVSLLR
jgi:hypothetical protein